MSDPTQSGCPIASALDLLGDRWTLVVLRDVLTGKRLFKEFLDSPEGISTNILADRLRRLEEWGLLERRAYQQNPQRHAYVLTKKGADLLPALQALCRWANRYIEDTWCPPTFFMKSSPTEILKRVEDMEAPPNG